MEKLKPNYNFFLLNVFCVSLVIIFIFYFLNISTSLQIVSLLIMPFILTYIFKIKYNSSPYGFFVSENEIVFIIKNSRIATPFNNIKLQKKFFLSVLALNNNNYIELIFYDKLLIEKIMEKANISL